MKYSLNEFHISRAVRDTCNFDKALYSSSGNVIFANFKAVQEFQIKLNELFENRMEEEKKVSAGSINAMALIDEIFHVVCAMFRVNKAPLSFTNLMDDLDTYFGKEKMDQLYTEFMQEFPPVVVYQKKLTCGDYLFQSYTDALTGKERSNREQVLEEMILLHLANENPAFHPFSVLFDDTKLSLNADYIRTWNQIKAYFKTQPVFGSKNNDLITMLKEPVNASPTSLKGQLDYIREHWYEFVGDIVSRILEGMDTITEEEKAFWAPMNDGPADMAPYSYENLMNEYERFSPDRDWMPKVVLMAKTVLVWMDQLSKKYRRTINRLDEIPDEELDALRDEGFTGLWLIGLWERSRSSKRIKQICGNPEAAASAYSLLDYDIAQNLGGWDALDNLRRRCWVRGIRLASDMVPNHTGIDGTWVIEHPDYFISRKDNPFPQYTYTGENLSTDPRISLFLEDHYYSKNDCAVCFKRVDNQTGDVTYIYHGNDGTGLPWNDTAQIDFLNAEAREEVMQKILHVARNFPIIRFDAAMVLAKKHIRRLWYPEPGHGGDIATRSQYALSTQDFEERIPNEFWREVVDRCAEEMPDTLLLAEAFWMMEGYFTRTLGMHRVYNSAFMNMLKKEENQKYRDTVKNTIKFDPQVLKRFVNFMNNPDEETAVAQFGKGDKYFGVCVLMSTMPGLPMFGHGQLEGFEEKYGMEYTKAYRNESPDEELMKRHRSDIFPLLKKRYLFAQIENFLFYDVWNNGVVNENVFAYSNGVGEERAIVFYNNKYEQASGWIKQSCEYAVKNGTDETDVVMYTKSLAEGLNLTGGSDHFCIFREQKKNLWYVRRSDELISGGMYVSLNGFEYQVYLDVQQVTDTADGKYAKLCELLAGRGVPDLDTAWQEYQYRDLYAKLNKFISKEFLEQMKLVFTPLPQLKAIEKDMPDLTKLLESTKEQALEYYQAELEFAERDAKEYLRKQLELKEANSKAGRKRAVRGTALSQKEARHFEKSITATPEERYASFVKQIEFLAKSFISVQASEQTLSENTQLIHKKTRPSFKLNYDNIIYEGLLSYENSAAILCTYAAVSSAGSKNCLAWGYNRKLTEILTEAGVTADGMNDTFRKLFLMMHIRDFNFGSTGQAKSTYEVATLLVNSKYSAFLVGANEYNGINWFNKEKMEHAMWFGFASVLMYSPRIMREQIYKLYRTLNAAKEGAEYQCEKLSSALKPAAPAKIAAGSGKGKNAVEEKTDTSSAKKSSAEKKTSASSKKASTSAVKKSTAEKKSASPAKKASAEKKASASSKKASTSAVKKSTAEKKSASPAKKSSAEKETSASSKKASTSAVKKSSAEKKSASPAKKSSAEKKTSASSKKASTSAVKKSTAEKKSVSSAKKSSAEKKTSASSKKASTSEKKKSTSTKAAGTSATKKAPAGKKAEASAMKTSAAKKAGTKSKKS